MYTHVHLCLKFDKHTYARTYIIEAHMHTQAASPPYLIGVSKCLLSEQHPVSIIASITTGGSRRRKSSAGDDPLPKWMTEQSHVWIIDGESMGALWQYPSRWESYRETAFKNWKTVNNKMTFIFFQVVSPPLTRTHPGNGLSSQWRGTSGIKEKSRKYAAAKIKKLRLSESLY